MYEVRLITVIDDVLWFDRKLKELPRDTWGATNGGLLMRY
jgi:hypothetical protein